ncbi:MAG: hypothetical protein IKF68_06660 [Erysipelotrichaceae bacterium]|nr:hypothetical protein [Erysipelotrichaceae bacterium]
MNRRIFSCLFIVLLLFTCMSCRKVEACSKNDYLDLLCEKAGLGDDDRTDALIGWGVLREEEKDLLDGDLDYDFLALTIGRLTGIEDDALNVLKDRGWISRTKKASDIVDEKTAEEVIDKAVYDINNRTYDPVYEVVPKDTVNTVSGTYTYEETKLVSDEAFDQGDILYLEEEGVYKKVTGIEDGAYLLEDASFNDIFSAVHIEDSYEVDFSEAIDIPYGTIENDDSVYRNEGKTLLAARKDEKSFTVDGFRVTYSFKGNALNVHIAKNKDGLNVFYDLSLHSVRPSYKWDYAKGKVNEAFLKVDYSSTSELGVSTGRYRNYYLDLKELDPQKFLSSLGSVIRKKDDEVETSIKICEIKTPIPQVPTAFFNIDVYARIYSSGKAEIVLADRNSLGFEIKNSHIRYINDGDRDLDLNIGGSIRLVLGLNFNLEAVSARLMDVEADGGLRASVATTLHLYDEDGEMNDVLVDMPYSAVNEVARENDDVRVCGDVSLNWVLELTFNTSKTLLYRLGLTAKKTVLDKGDQIFGNRTHIENGVFVDSCTRKGRYRLKDRDRTSLNVDKIILGKYAAVIRANENYTIPLESLPKGYTRNDLIYKTSNSSVASVSDGIVSGIRQGASEITISTKDGKYYAALNVLVSES